MQREMFVENNQIVIREDGVSVRYPLSIVQKRVKELSAQLDLWREYESRLLTPRALDGVCSCPKPKPNSKKFMGVKLCLACGQPRQ